MRMYPYSVNRCAVQHNMNNDTHAGSLKACHPLENLRIRNNAEEEELITTA